MATTTVATTAEIPKALQPYYTGTGAGAQGFGGLLPAAQQFYARGYEDVYGAPLAASGLAGAGRVADMSPFQLQVGRELASMGTPQQFTTATGYGADAAGGFGALQGAQAQQISGNVMAPSVTAGTVGAGSVGIGSITGEGILGQYMSPYMDAVVEQQKQAAIRDAQRSNLQQNLMAGRQGTYGGARSLLAGLERERGLSSQMGNIEATGRQQAYQQALGQFNVENQLGLTAQQTNVQSALQAALANQQYGYQAQAANQQASLEAARQNLAAQQSNQQAALTAQQQRLGASQGLAGLAGTMGQLGVQQQASDLERIRSMGAYGDLERGVQQQGIDASYEDLMNRLGYERQRINEFSSVLRGVPLGDLVQRTTTPAPSFASQLAGGLTSGFGLLGLLNQQPGR